jgi:hypothetical protein
VHTSFYKFILITLSVILLSSIAACGGGGEADPSGEANPSDNPAENQENGNFPLFSGDENATCTDLYSAEMMMLEKIDRLTISKNSRAENIKTLVGEITLELDLVCRSDMRRAESANQHLNVCAARYEEKTQQRHEQRKLITKRKNVIGKILDRAKETLETIRSHSTDNGHDNPEDAEALRSEHANACNDNIELAEEQLREEQQLPERTPTLDLQSELPAIGEQRVVEILLNDGERANIVGAEFEPVESVEGCEAKALEVVELQRQVAELEAQVKAFDEDIETLKNKHDSARTSSSETCAAYVERANILDGLTEQCTATIDILSNEDGGEIAELQSIADTLDEDNALWNSTQNAVAICNAELETYTGWLEGEDQVRLPAIEGDYVTVPEPLIGQVHNPDNKSPFNLDCPDGRVLIGLGIKMKRGIDIGAIEINRGIIKHLRIMCMPWSQEVGLHGVASWAGGEGNSNATTENKSCPTGYAIGALHGLEAPYAGIDALTFTCKKVSPNGIEKISISPDESRDLYQHKATGIDASGKIGSHLDFWQNTQYLKVGDNIIENLALSATNDCGDQKIARGIRGTIRGNHIKQVGLRCSGFIRGENIDPIIHLAPTSWQNNSSKFILPLWAHLNEGNEFPTADLFATIADSNITANDMAISGVAFSYKNRKLSFVKPLFISLSQTSNEYRQEITGTAEFGINPDGSSIGTSTSLSCPVGYLVTGMFFKPAGSGNKKVKKHISLRCSPLLANGLMDLDNSLWTWKFGRKKMDSGEQILCGGATGKSHAIATGLVGKTHDERVSSVLGLECSELSSHSD